MKNFIVELKKSAQANQKSLLIVVKEAIRDVKQKYPIEGRLLTTEELASVSQMYKDHYLKQSFWWKAVNSFESYKQMCVLELQYKFCAVARLDTDKEISIKIK